MVDSGVTAIDTMDMPFNYFGMIETPQKHGRERNPAQTSLSIEAMIEPMEQLLRRAARLHRDGRSVVACLIVKTHGSTPQTAGALMLVDDAANTWGTIGGGCVEAEVRRRAHALLSERGNGILQFSLDHDDGGDDGLICGGTIHLIVAPLPKPDELDVIADDVKHRRSTSIEFAVQDEHSTGQRYTLDLPPRDRLYIAGAGYVGQALARLAIGLEFEVTMFDDRGDMLERYAHPEAKKVPGDIAGELKAADIDDRTYCVIVTRGHRHDEQALGAVIQRGARYIGMIGSKRKVQVIFDDLRAVGLDDAALEAVVAPIGIDIGSVTVDEIALSIAAQLVKVRRSDSIELVKGPFALASSDPGGSVARP